MAKSKAVSSKAVSSKAATKSSKKSTRAAKAPPRRAGSPAATPKAKQAKVQYVKGAQTAYILFCQEHSQTNGLTKEAMGARFSIKERGKACGAAWGEIKDNNAARRRYDDLALADVERFRSEYFDKYGYEPPEGRTSDDHKPTKRKRTAKAAATATADDGGDDDDEASGSGGAASAKKAKRTTKKQQKDPNAPKRARTAYILYTIERRPALKTEEPTLTNTELTATMGAEWTQMSDDQKRPYQQAYEQEKKAYEKKMAKYVPSRDA